MRHLLFTITCILFHSSLQAKNLDISDESLPSYADLNNWRNTTEMRGKPGEDRITLVVFWATWCEPCIEKIPKLNSIFNEYGKQIDIIGVCLSAGSGNYLENEDAYAITYPTAVDANDSWQTAFSVHSVPHIRILVPGRPPNQESIPVECLDEVILTAINGGNIERIDDLCMQAKQKIISQRLDTPSTVPTVSSQGMRNSLAVILIGLVLLYFTQNTCSTRLGGVLWPVGVYFLSISFGQHVCSFSKSAVCALGGAALTFCLFSSLMFSGYLRHNPIRSYLIDTAMSTVLSLLLLFGGSIAFQLLSVPVRFSVPICLSLAGSVAPAFLWFRYRKSTFQTFGFWVIHSIVLTASHLVFSLDSTAGLMKMKLNGYAFNLTSPVAYAISGGIFSFLLCRICRSSSLENQKSGLE